MGENKNLSVKEVQKISKNFPLTPRFNNVVITLNRVENEGLEYSDSILDESQYVVAIGSMVNDLKPGQKVLIDLERMTFNMDVETEDGYRKVPQIKINPVRVGETVYTFIDDRYIKSIDNR